MFRLISSRHLQAVTLGINVIKFVLDCTIMYIQLSFFPGLYLTLPSALCGEQVESI
jgi:hypothetical protein